MKGKRKKAREREAHESEMKSLEAAGYCEPEAIVMPREAPKTDALQVRYPRIGWGWWLVEILKDVLRVRRAPVPS